MKLSIVSIICISVFLPVKQLPEFKYINVPDKYLQRIDEANTERKKFFDSLKNPYHLEKSLPSNFVKDGSVDYTNYLQTGINTNNDIIFPDFPVLINESGLKLKSNTRLYFPEHSKVLLKPNNLPGYQILSIKNVQNVYLYYPNIIGDREKHLTDKGNWGFGISIQQSENITIENPRVSLCYGDGIYIGGSKKTSSNITINNALVDNNRRDGLSITSGENIKINSSIFSNSNGRAPAAGIQIEPNDSTNQIDKIDIINTVTFNNQQTGIMVNLVKLNGDDLKKVNIQIDNHIDDNSNYAMGLWISRLSKKKITKNLIGNIHITGCKWINNRTEAFRYFEKDNNNSVDVLFKDIKIYNKNNSANADSIQLNTIKNKFSGKNRFKFSN